MEQYPTPEDEFEMMYGDDLEAMDELHEVNDAFQSKKLPQTNEQPCTSKSILSSLRSPQLSQIAFDEASLAQVNRRLFGTPPIAMPKRISSTPNGSSDNDVPITERQQLDPLVEIQNTDFNTRKRRLEDIFGDIRDIEDEILDSIAKKLKSDEERDFEMIEQILEVRKRLQENKNPRKKDDVEKLNALHAFKMKNLSNSVPKYSFIALMRNEEDRLYVRMHSDDLLTKQINDISILNRGHSGLLGDAKEHTWNTARELAIKRMTRLSKTAANTLQPVDVSIVENHQNVEAEISLWVEKYKPKKYIDLLSDESTNRNLLYWLKMWDKIVFGREFKAVEEQKGRLNSFNKKTGRFESNGGWTRRTKQNLNTDRDEHGRPVQKVALLCGTPGLGKTTLAHIIARHAGYNAREINASDDRSPEAFRLALENGTQMTSVLNQDKKPNCIILDEIDGAPIQSIDFLIKFVSGQIIQKSKRGTAGKTHKFILKRPIICICNDMYVPALKQLRQIAFVVNFPPIASSRLAERLLDIARREEVKTDLSSLIALAEKSRNDIRSCISMMQFFKYDPAASMKKRLGLEEVLNSNLGLKDRHRGLFGVWQAIFQIQRPQKQISCSSSDNKVKYLSMSDKSQSTRAIYVLDVVHMEGDYERLTQGVYENYLSQKMPDPNMQGVVEAIQWFCFSDRLQHFINTSQNYAVYPYLQYGFVIWHLLFASLAWPKINFPNKNYEFNQKLAKHKMIFHSFRKGVTGDVVGVGQGKTLLIDTIPLLKQLLSPNLRSVSLQLLTSKERFDLKHTVEVMADLGLAFTQGRAEDGTYQYQIEPDIELLCHFEGFTKITLSYFGRQLISREIELEQMRRAAPKLLAVESSKVINAKKMIQKSHARKSPENLPNHLQVLKPKIIRSTNTKETVSKDFFGRMTTKHSNLTVQEGGTDIIVKSPIWYRYKEGFNNAVRKDILISDLL